MAFHLHIVSQSDLVLPNTKVKLNNKLLTDSLFFVAFMEMEGETERENGDDVQQRATGWIWTLDLSFCTWRHALNCRIIGALLRYSILRCSVCPTDMFHGFTTLIRTTLGHPKAWTLLEERGSNCSTHLAHKRSDAATCVFNHPINHVHACLKFGKQVEKPKAVV